MRIVIDLEGVSSNQHFVLVEGDVLQNKANIDVLNFVVETAIIAVNADDVVVACFGHQTVVIVGGYNLHIDSIHNGLDQPEVWPFEDRHLAIGVRGDSHLLAEVEPVDAASCVDFEYLVVIVVGEELVHKKIFVRSHCELLSMR